MIEKKKLLSFEKKILYKFKNTSLLEQALTHPSHYKDTNSKKLFSNQFERLEFLGDRVLGVIIAYLLVKKFKEFDEGDLSKKYSYLVQKKFLQKISDNLLIKDILLYNFKKNNKMNASILSDAVESLIGAIFLDGGYKASFNFINKYWSPYLDIKISKTQDPKTTLQEISQSKSKKLPEYKLLNKKGPPHSPIFTVSLRVLNLKIIKSKGSSIRDAEKNAAMEALKKLDEK
tara:strand:- start:186 stop:878 length:693 start_codon:yes stop_codon:yes gene_type:complete